MTDAARRLATPVLLQHIASGVEIAYPFPGLPQLELRIEGALPRLTLRIPSGLPAPRGFAAMKNVRLASVASSGGPILAVSVSGEALMLDGHAMLCSIVDRIQLKGQDAISAISETLDQWRSVLAARTRMSVEQEVGLFGELLVLEAALHVEGLDAVTSWRGFANEEHDFGFADLDLEVKTTTTERRAHWISSLRQLQPSKDRDLALLSIQLTRGGTAGRSLAGLIACTRGQVGDPDAFDKALHAAGWSEPDADLFADLWTLRTEPKAYSVVDQFPRLTPTLLQSLPVDTAVVVDVRYRIDIENWKASKSMPPMPDILRTMTTKGGKP